MSRIERRVGLLFCVFALLLSVAFGRAAWLQAVKGSEYRASAHSQQTESVTVPAQRGRVLDRTGKVLAVSEDAASVVATPYQVREPAPAAALLAPVLGEPAGKLEEALDDPRSGFAYLSRKVDLGTAERVRELDLTGISLLPDSRRLYPQGELAAQVIGAVGIDNDGLTGLEQSEEEVLGGTDGEREVVKDALGKPIRFNDTQREEFGDELRLTIDAAIQGVTEEALAEIGEAHAPEGATAIVLNPASGDVLALANWPPFDPNHLEAAEEDDLANRATGFTYEPGSTFKAITVAAALEESTVTPETAFDLPPMIEVADREIEEAHPRGPVTLTVAEILAQSSNVGAVTIGLRTGSEAFDRWVGRFGFGEPTGIRFPGEERGIVPALDEYSGSTLGNLSIGQGLSVTPVQMAAAYAAIANGGVLRTPRLIAAAGGEEVAPEEGERILRPGVAKRVRGMLEGVLTPGGTAAEIEVPGYTLGGKTGTAEKAEEGGYSESRYVASFIGFAPARNPRLLAAVVVDEPAYVHTGAEVAAPAFARIAEFALPYLGISPG